MSFIDRFPRLFDKFQIKIACLGLAILLYVLFRSNTLTERQLSIPLDVLTPEGFVVSSEYPRHINVEIRGEEEDILGILNDDLKAFVNLSFFPEEGEYRVDVEFQKTGMALQADTLEFRPNPRSLTLSLERRSVRSLEVNPQIMGFPALGYELTQYFLSPSTITAVGPQSQMTLFENLSTELIDISGRRDDFTVTTRIVLPSPLVEIPGGQVIEFRGVIDESVIIRTIADRELVVFDLPEGLSIDGELPRVNLTVQGSQLTVEGSRPQDMTFYIEGSNISSPGIYVLPLSMDIPQGLALLQISPREVEIKVIRAENTENNALLEESP